MVDENGQPFLKKWQFITSSERLAQSLDGLKCQHERDFRHAEISGSKTKGTESYPTKLCHTILSGLFGHWNAVPAMPCIEIQDYGHVPPGDLCEFGNLVPPNDDMPPLVDEGDDDSDNTTYDPHFSTSPSQFLSDSISDVTPMTALVTKLLDRREYYRDPRAKQAIRDEGKSLVDQGTWLLHTVPEKQELLSRARATGKRLHYGDLNPICSIKFHELPPNHWIYKGRITFRGDNTRDEEGAYAVFQELSASPTSIQDANCAIAYGLMIGNRTTTADAVKAYIQALLRSKYPTWVRVPKELWPEDGSWDNKYTQPMCLLERALYGHPESGAHWEKHFTDIVLNKLGGEKIPDHPSLFWFPTTRLLLTVYVDDLLLSGPTDAHDQFWENLKEHVNIDSVGPLDRFLGRNHVTP